MPKAEIIAIGTELLLGETLDTNSRHIARALRDAGMDLFWISTVGDNEGRIATAIRLGLERSDVIITTGGLGPTVDDATREAVARAVGVQAEYRPDLWEQILERYRSYGRQPTENNRRQAHIPEHAIPLRNPIGTAPAFIVEIGEQAVICLPGVPREMEHLLETEVLPYLRDRYHLHGMIAIRVLHTAGAGESQIDDLIGDLEQLNNPTVGLAAHSGQVDVRITAKANTLTEAEALIATLETQIRARLGKWIYGADEETLEGVALRGLAERGWKLVVVEGGVGCNLVQRLEKVPEVFLRGEILAGPPDTDALLAETTRLRATHAAEVGLGVALHPRADRQEIHLVLATPQGEQRLERSYGGPPGYAPRWAVNLSLDLLRNL